MGLQLESTEENSLPYVTPPFERAALLASGISNYPMDWRRGDLWRFRRTEVASEVELPPLPEKTRWREHVIEGVRIRIRDGEAPRQSSLLWSLVPGDVLPSVSRRLPLREQVGLWTSCNRVLGCGDADAASGLVTGFASDPGTMPDRTDPASLARLRAIVDLEFKEIAAYR